MGDAVGTPISPEEAEAAVAPADTYAGMLLHHKNNAECTPRPLCSAVMTMACVRFEFGCSDAFLLAFFE